MEKFRKGLSIVTIISAVVVSLFLIIWLFGADLLGSLKSNIYLTLGSIAVGGFFAINSLNMVLKNKILGYVSFGLITGSVVLIILTSWLNLNNSTLTNIMVSLGLLSVLFNIIVSSGLDLGKTLLAVQIPVYIIAGITDLVSTLIIFGALDISKMFALFLALIIVTIVGIIILKVLAKRQVTNEILDEKEMVKISKSEYTILIDKAKKYDELMSNQNNNQ